MFLFAAMALLCLKHVHQNGGADKTFWFHLGLHRVRLQIAFQEHAEKCISLACVS